MSGAEVSREGMDLKFARARTHYEELAAMCSEYEASVGVQEVEHKSDQFDVYVRMPPIPPEIALLIGDAAHNARAALDHLACQLVILGGGAVGRWTEFPVHDSPTGFGGRLAAKLKGARLEHRDLVRELKPYEGGDDQLWRLHRLDVADKHQLLTPTMLNDRAAAMRGGFPGFPSMTVVLPHEPAEGARQPLKDGDLLYSMSRGPVAFSGDVDPKDLEFNIDLGAATHLSFGDIEDLQGQPIASTVAQLVEHAVTVVEPLGQLLERNS